MENGRVMWSKRKASLALTVAAIAAAVGGGAVQAVNRQELDVKVDQSVATFKTENPKGAELLSKANGVLACPVIRKAGTRPRARARGLRAAGRGQDRQLLAGVRRQLGPDRRDAVPRPAAGVPQP